MTRKVFVPSKPRHFRYEWIKMYSVREMCQILGVHEEDFFEKSFRKEILKLTK